MAEHTEYNPSTDPLADEEPNEDGVGDDARVVEPRPGARCPGDESMILIRVEDVFTEPSDDVFVGAWGFPDHDFCIDRYEASRGTDGAAMAVAGVMPWINATWEIAVGACAAAGKRVCTTPEWMAACHGP